MKAEQREPKKYINSVAYLLVIILNNLKQRVYFTIISNNKVVVYVVKIRYVPEVTNVAIVFTASPS